MEPALSSTSRRGLGRRSWRVPRLLALILLSGFALPATAAAAEPKALDPFARFDLPDDWEARFWASPDVRALFRSTPRAVADLVPIQAGIRFCRCPACDATESDDPLAWHVATPQSLVCRRCGETVSIERPLGVEKKKDASEKKNEDTDKKNEKNEKKTSDGGKEDAKKGDDKEKDKDKDKDKDKEEKKKPAEDAIEVLPGVIHHYPYQEVDAERQRYPDERLYLAAKRDDEAREFLAKVALYAAVRYHEQPAGGKNSDLARVAAVILIRFAQVYPAYALHYDQPESPKYFDKANLLPPYRRGYQTGKWGWTGSQDVPLNLVVAYALLRDDPALSEAGQWLGEPDPARAIERDLFRASAEFVRRQPEEFSEASLQVDRGLLAVGRLLDDPALTDEALVRLERFAERGFYHDGFWRQGTLQSHRRVLGQLDGWIDRLLGGPGEALRGAAARPGAAVAPMLALARAAGSAVLTDPSPREVRQVSFFAPTLKETPRAPILLGGAGLARLAIGRDDDALDVELRGLDSPGPDQIERQALRLAVGGRTVLGDLDEGPGLPSGFDRAAVSRNTVVVDGLNPRESLATAREPAAGGNFVFFAADPDFQVVTLDDPRSYPQSTTRYRQTVVASASARSRYALAVFEVHGGLQHDQLFHVPSGSKARWRLSEPTSPGPATLLAPGLTFVPTLRAEDGRWFVQSYGEFAPLSRATITRPAQAWPVGAGPNGATPGVRLHLLGDAPMTAIAAASPDPLGAPRRGPGDDAGRGGLILRRRSADGSTLRTTFVTLFEPVSTAIPPLARVGRITTPTPSGGVVVYVETADGPEHLVVNPAPGTPLTATLVDGRALTTDGLVARLTTSGLVLAGGTFAECGGQVVRLPRFAGKIVWSVRRPSAESRGWFESDAPLPAPETLAGRVLLIRHGDGTTHGWTLQRVENTPTGARLFVREEPGFLIDAPTGAARYYQFPRSTLAGPHPFRVSRIAR